MYYTDAEFIPTTETVCGGTKIDYIGNMKHIVESHSSDTMNL